MDNFNKLRNDLYCQYCKKQCKSLNSLKQHEIRCKENPNRIESGNAENLKKYQNQLRNGERHQWSKGLTKETDIRLQKISIAVCNAFAKKKANGEICSTGKAKTEEKEQLRKQRISNGMKKAHNEGRANNWQDSGIKNGIKISYPEQFMINVIENEFNDKNYIFQYRVNKYSLDFAWPLKRVYIEIDGSQHENNKEYDNIRDTKLKSLGWTVLRVKWIDLFHDTKRYIQIMKQFIDKAKELEVTWEIDYDLKTHKYLPKYKR